MADASAGYDAGPAADSCHRPGEGALRRTFFQKSEGSPKLRLVEHRQWYHPL